MMVQAILTMSARQAALAGAGPTGGNISIIAISEIELRFPDGAPLPWRGPGSEATQGCLITLETKLKSTVDGHIETYRSENDERHERMRARERRLCYGNSDEDDDEEDLAYGPRSFKNTFHSTQRTNQILRGRRYVAGTPLDNAVKNSASRKSQSSAPGAPTKKETSEAEPYREYSAIDAAIARFREDNDEKKTANTLNDLSSAPITSPNESFPVNNEVKTSEPTSSDNSSKPETVVPGNLPSILQVNKESRGFGLKRFTLTLHKQRDGKAIYIDYSRDALCLQDLRTLEALCGRRISVPRNRLMAIIDERSPKPKMSEERNDPKKMLRFLSFAEVVTDRECLLSSLIARFQNLEMVTLKKVPRAIRGDGSMAPYHRGAHLGGRWAYEDTKILEGKLKELWAKDDEKRGMQCTPNKIPKFNFLDDPGLRVPTPNTGHSQPGTFGSFQAAPQTPQVHSTPHKRMRQQRGSREQLELERLHAYKRARYASS
ncbi:hypothetical protein DL98DRAFT_534186 [Cadophora sp. DSE1049]|nr:hypothetical protein DL98DRAFT_534186 [Cadophora sp. DSE1049]